MIVVRKIAPYVVDGDEPVSHALAKIEANRRGCVVVTERDGQLVGTLTDGDFRRWLVAKSLPTLTAPSREVANRFCTAPLASESPSTINDLLDDGLDLVPLLDDRGRVVAVALQSSRDLFIGDRRISLADSAFVIAEIGINHNGDFETGKRLVESVADSGADCAKFQLRNLESLYRKGTGSSAGEDLGAEYTLDLLAESSLDSSTIFALMDYSRELGLVPLCTPWDAHSAAELAAFGVSAFKVASADLTNHPLLRQLAEYGLPLIVSTGMSTEAEIVEAVELLRGYSASFALLQCNSAYPAAYKDLNLAYMNRLAAIGDCIVGYSGHERGTHVAVAAVARGAKIVEKHITLDRRMRGNDHVVSLEPDEFGEMVRYIREVESALGTEDPRTLTQGEQLNRLALAKSLVASTFIDSGTVLEERHIESRSPGRGLQPNRIKELLGRAVQRDIAAGDFFYESDVNDSTSGPRNYHFDRPWGIPVRFHDWVDLAHRSNPDFLEFHLSYRDMDSNYVDLFQEALPYALVVHSPDLFTDDHILDLASPETAVWERSVVELQRVLDLTAALRERFTGTMPPKVVASLGGSSMHAPVPVGMREEMYERVSRGLQMLETHGIEILAQTLPPFPWYLGGQRYCNLFVDPHETVLFSKSTGTRLCLDIAHTKLACTHLRLSFTSAIEALAPVAGHLHLVDAAGLDGEGLQILEGDVDWGALVPQLDRLAPGVSFIPEIWQGHVGNGQGFWVALERLEALFRKS